MKPARLGIAGLGILLGLTFGNLETKAQSLESQLKVIGGDLLSNSQSQLARTIGKALSTSGTMQYEIERAEAGRNQINIEQNNFPEEYLVLSEDGKYSPTQGYEWANPDDATDFILRKISSLESRASLAPFDMGKLESEYNKRIGHFATGIETVFTCNWYKDFNGDGLSLDEFKGIKRTFNKDEKIEIVGICGSNLSDIKKKDFPLEEIVTFRLYRGKDGEFLAKEEQKYTHFLEDSPPQRFEIYWIDNEKILGEDKSTNIYGKKRKTHYSSRIESTTINPGVLPPAKYIYSIEFGFPNHPSKFFTFPRIKSGEFEIIE